MGTGNLPDLAAAPTKVDATTTQYNAITDALQGHQVMRDSSGVAEDNTSDIGRPSSGRPRKIYAGTGLNVAGSDIDFSSITLQTTGISSGKSKTSGYPNFLTPEGVTGGATNAFTIEATTTNLEITIDGAAYTLETDLASDDLALAPSSNNTCLVNDGDLVPSTGTSTDQYWTKTIGEYGFYIDIDAVGSEITSLNNTKQCFSITNGVDTEYFLAAITTNKLTPFIRGIGATDRIAFSDNDTITLLKAHYIFLDNDLATIDTTTTYPTRGPSAPAAPAAGAYHYYTLAATTGWHRYSGASWEKLGRVYLGYAICDSADCLAVEHEDYNLSWNDEFNFTRCEIDESNSDTIVIKAPLNYSVAGTNIVVNDTVSIDITDSNNWDDDGILTYNWAFVYGDNLGNFYFSQHEPRKKDARKGWYHPKQYWRLITWCYFYDTYIGRFFHESDVNFSVSAISDIDGGGAVPVISKRLFSTGSPGFITKVGVRTYVVDSGGAPIIVYAIKPRGTYGLTVYEGNESATFTIINFVSSTLLTLYTNTNNLTTYRGDINAMYHNH